MDVPGRRQSRVDTSAMLRISWTERTSKEYILRDIRPPQRLSSTVCFRVLTFLWLHHQGKQYGEVKLERMRSCRRSPYR